MTAFSCRPSISRCCLGEGQDSLHVYNAAWHGHSNNAQQHASMRNSPMHVQQTVATRFQHLDDQDEAAHAQQIVKELHHRYEKQQQRWRDYRTLFAFLAFIAW